MTRCPFNSESLYTPSSHCASQHFDDRSAAQFVSPAFSSAFGPRHHFHFSFLVGAGWAFVESAAGGPRYRMAHPNRRADSGDSLSSAYRSAFFHHAGPALVCLGVAVRHTTRDSAPGMRTERSGLAVLPAGSGDLRAAAFAIDEARDGSAAGGLADAAGGGRRDYSFVCAPAHCYLAFFSALVCCA